jgi:hypothetical protein
VFGERAQILEPVGSAYALMLQIAVYPYLLCALLVGLGRLTPGMARRLFNASWGPYLFMWAVTLGSIWLLARAIPPTPPPSVVQADAVHLARASSIVVIIGNAVAVLQAPSGTVTLANNQQKFCGWYNCDLSFSKRRRSSISCLRKTSCIVGRR